MLRVFANRFDDEEQSARAVDLAGYAVGHSGPDEPAFGKVMKPVDALRVAVLQKKHGARGVFRPRDQEQVIGAEIEHGMKDGGGNARLPPAAAAPLWGYPADSSARDIVTARRMTGAGSLGRRIRIPGGLAQAFPAEQNDLGILDKPVGDSGGDRGIEQDVAPVGERCVRCNDGRSFVAVTGRDDLVKQVRRLLVQREIAQFIHNEQCGLGVVAELAYERMIDLRRAQVIEHIHGRSEQNAMVCLAGTPADSGTGKKTSILMHSPGAFRSTS